MSVDEAGQESKIDKGSKLLEEKKLVINAFVMNSPGHLAPGLWKHPRNNIAEYTNLKYWMNLAQLLDKANFHPMFVADALGGYDVYKGPADVGP
jgi:hypothetical protein